MDGLYHKFAKRNTHFRRSSAEKPFFPTKFVDLFRTKKIWEISGFFFFSPP
jgi:hypothetical protein